MGFKENLTQLRTESGAGIEPEAALCTLVVALHASWHALWCSAGAFRSVFAALGLPLGRSWPLFGRSWPLLDRSLERSGGTLGCPWDALGRSWVALAHSWELWGLSRGALGRSQAALGSFKSDPRLPKNSPTTLHDP